VGGKRGVERLRGEILWKLYLKKMPVQKITRVGGLTWVSRKNPLGNKKPSRYTEEEDPKKTRGLLTGWGDWCKFEHKLWNEFLGGKEKIHANEKKNGVRRKEPVSEKEKWKKAP